MSDLIDRQAAIDAIERRLAEPNYQHTGEDWYVGMNCAESEIYELPSAYEGVLDKSVAKRLLMQSAQPESKSLRKQGEWDMFELITSAWYGKQYYFREHDDIVYSRKSGKNMTVNEAISEFIREISDDGSY